MTKNLSKSQIDSIPSWVQKGIDLGFATNAGTSHIKANLDTIIDLTNQHRTVNGKRKAKYFTFAKSPQDAINSTKGAGLDVYNAFYGNQDAHWLNYYAFWRYEVGHVKQTEKINYLHKLCSYVSWMWMGEDTTIVCPLPTVLHTAQIKIPAQRYDGTAYALETPTPHSFTERALSWEDGTGFYAIYGTRIPERLSWIITTPAESLDPQKILSIENEDIKAAAIKKIGLERMFDKLDKTLIEEKSYPKGGRYKLWSIEFHNEEVRRHYLEMCCPSKKDTHIEAVPPNCNSVDQARAWRLPYDQYGNPVDSDAILNSTEFVYEEPEVHT